MYNLRNQDGTQELVVCIHVLPIARSLFQVPLYFFSVVLASVII